jgi:hypothetical protein|tara:strand:+ start:1701 stop:1919 length:219 start_codon:yes stop_codon:yes gene_type:complete
MKDHKLSNQAVGAIMMALQKSLMEQTDIVPVLKNFNVQVDDSGELVVMNPPTVEVKEQKTKVITGLDIEGPL